MRNISYKIAPDLIQPLQFRDIVANYDGASRLVGSLLDRNSGDFDVPLAMGSNRQGSTRCASLRRCAAFPQSASPALRGGPPQAKGRQRLALAVRTVSRTFDS